MRYASSFCGMDAAGAAVTDAGGSIRIPAAFCGIVGLKPLLGEIPHWPAARSVTLGPRRAMTWNGRRCRLM